MMYGCCFLAYFKQIPTVERYTYISYIKIPRAGLPEWYSVGVFLIVVSVSVVKNYYIFP